MAGTRGNLLNVLAVFLAERFMQPLWKGLLCRR
jgi:hypothetical protein